MLTTLSDHHHQLSLSAAASIIIITFWCRINLTSLLETNTIENRIVGGENARADAVPYQALIRRHHLAGVSQCGAILIHPDWILTAAHCVNDFGPNVPGIVAAKPIEAFFGVTRLAQLTQFSTIERSAAQDTPQMLLTYSYQNLYLPPYYFPHFFYSTLPLASPLSPSYSYYRSYHNYHANNEAIPVRRYVTKVFFPPQPLYSSIPHYHNDRQNHNQHYHHPQHRHHSHHNREIHFSADIALLRLNQSVPLSDTIRVIELPNYNITSFNNNNNNYNYLPPSGDWFANQIGTVSGFGATTFDAEAQGPHRQRKLRPSESLRAVRIPILPKNQCAQMYREAFADGARAAALVRPDSILCAGGLPDFSGRDACVGDSGGPLAVCAQRDLAYHFNQNRHHHHHHLHHHHHHHQHPNYQYNQNQNNDNNSGGDINNNNNNNLGIDVDNDNAFASCKSGSKWILAGIISVGYKCAEPGIPGLYVNVAYFVDWIRRVIDAEQQQQ